MRPKAVYPIKICVCCGKQITTRYAEGLARFSQRQYCGKDCQHAHQPMPHGKRRSDQRDPSRTWGSAKLTELEVITMRELRWTGRVPYSALCKMFGRSHHAIWAVCNGETWTHLPMPRVSA